MRILALACGACLLILFAGCGPEEERPLRTLGRPLVGVPQDGYPNYNERLMLTAINRCRADPNVVGETKESCSVDRSIYPPLMRNQNGSRAARFHCANCIINDGGLSHSSYCTLRSDIGDTFEDTCDGSADCACQPGSEHFSCTTLGGSGTGVGTRCGYFGYSASGEVGAAGYGDGWSAVWGWISECPADGDGHRRILTGDYDEIGLGFYTGSTQCWSRLYFGDLGNNAPFTYTLPAGVHRSRSGTYDFLVNYYDPGGAPDSVNLVLDGTCYPMALEIGNADNATYKVNLDIGSGCHQYWFLVRDSSFNRVVYPEQGAWEVGSCSDYVANADVAECEVCTPGESKPCGLGQCAGNQACNAGGTWDPCDGAEPDPSESCDGVDNDCDGNLPADEADGDSDGYRICAGDCDDSDGGVHPGAADPCNGVDEACDGIGDEVDSDGDGAMVCESDCDDSDGDRYPGAQEICDGKDNDCDGSPGPGEVDSDSDTYMVCENDCDDSNENVHPGMTEICNNIDDDCDGATDNGLPDTDNDGHNSCVDCDDTDPDVHPGAAEACNGEDDDCDGSPGPGEVDSDSDTYMVCGNDCDDSNGDVHPDAAEACNEIDDNCDGTTDEGCECADGATRPCSSDVGECRAGTQACQDGQWGACNGVMPAPEECNGLDDNCDGNTDEICDCVAGESRPCGTDVGECQTGAETCQAGIWSDCQGGVQPTTEECNNLDDDCDGTTDEGCACTEGDSRPCGSDVGVCQPGTQTCESGAWGDCEGAVLPATEECNGQDDNCDGITDEGCPDDPGPTTIQGSCGCGGSGDSSLGILVVGIYPFLRRRRRKVISSTPVKTSQENSPATGS